MLQKIYVTIYKLPIPLTWLMLAVGTCIWAFVCRWYRRAPKEQKLLWKFLCAAGLLMWLAVILHITIFSRPGGELIVYRDFFHHLKEYLFCNGDRELLRTLWMNTLLFIPGGLCL